MLIITDYFVGSTPIGKVGVDWVSGTRQGGRSKVRSMLYMVVMGFSRCPKGKPARVALVAVMRKLIVLANQTLKNPNVQLAKCRQLLTPFLFFGQAIAAYTRRALIVRYDLYPNIGYKILMREKLISQAS